VQAQLAAGDVRVGGDLERVVGGGGAGEEKKERAGERGQEGRWT
jgi:hypothetical protein